MGKVVLNKCYGGFKLSQKAINWFLKHNLFTNLIHEYEEIEPLFDGKYYIEAWLIPRHHPALINCVEALKEDASSDYSNLEVVEFEGDLYRIKEYDGWESIETPNNIHWTNINNL